MPSPTPSHPEALPAQSKEAAAAPRRVDRAGFTREFPSGDATATECAQNLVRAAELFLDADARALKRHGLSTAARILLATIEGAGEPLPQSEIAERLFITGASVSSLVDTLERKALVCRVRSVTDRRIVLVALTDAAHPVVDAYLAEATTLHAFEFASLNEQERETLIVLLAKVSAGITALDVDAAVAKTLPRKRPRRGRR